LPPALYRSVNK